MKREFLSELFKNAGLEVGKDIVDKIMGENGNDIEAEKAKVTKAQTDMEAAKTEATTLKEQIAKRDADIEALKAAAGTSEELQAKYTELQTKYAADTKGLQDKLSAQTEEAKKQMEQQAYDFAAEKFFANVPFASELARKAALADFKEKGLKLDNGKFLGGDDWLTELKKADPAAFKPEEGGDGNSSPPPRFVNPTNNNPAGGGNNPFGNLGFAYVRQPPSEK